MKSQITDFFEQDHQRLDQLFAEYQRQKSNIEQATPLFLKFKQGLLQHIDWEEQLLFPSVEQAAGFPPNAGPTHVMRMEHSQIKDCLQLIEMKLSQQQDSQAIETRLLDILAGHNMKEEQVLYPMSDQSIPAEQAASIVDSCQNQQ